MGLLSFLLAIIALFKTWQHPLPILWWTIFILAILDGLIVSAIQNSIEMHGPKDKVTKFWVIAATIIQPLTILLSIFVIFF